MSATPDAVHPALHPDILHGFHLVEADAGTGKTWTLVALVVRALVERQLGIEQVLMVTFTRAAAAELRARVRERIEEMLRRCTAPGCDPADDPVAALLLARHDAAQLERTLRVALSRIDDAPIDTIHGLCQRIIREHALSVGAPARFEIDESGDRLVRSEVNRWWSEELGAASLTLVQLLGAAGGPTVDGVTALLRPLLAQPELVLRPEAFEWRSLAELVCRQRDDLLAAIAREGEDLARWCETAEGLKRASYNRKNVPAWLARIEQFAAALPQTVGKMEGDKALERLSSEGFASPDAGTCAAPPFALPGLLSALVATLRCLPLVAAAMCHELRAPLAERLRERHALARTLGFDDLLRITRDALRDPQLGARLGAQLRERYPLALIDECQDTDPLQWEIFSAIYPRPAEGEGAEPGEKRALVIVGDPKQAIYGFRNADIYAYFAARAGTLRHRIDENRRASAELLRCIGALFAAPTPFRIDEIEMHPPRFGERARPVLRDDDSAAARAAFNWVLVTDPGESGVNKEIARRRSAHATALEIARLLGDRATKVRWPANPVTGQPEREQRVQPRDVVVLVNTAFEARVVKQALAARGIAAAEISRESVFDTREARELGRILDAIARPASRSALRGALLTGLVGWSVQRLRECESDEAQGAALLAAFAGCARSWSWVGAQAALRALVLDVLAASGRIAAAPGGERALTNFAHLLDLMSDSPRTSDTPAAALAWLEAARADGALGEARELRLESDANLVQIVTIHKSKGLEFPIVFVPFAWSRRAPPRRSGMVPVLNYHEPYGGAWRAVCEVDEARVAPARRAQAEREAASEELRLLYVALTRAQLRAYLFWGDVSGASHTALGWLLAGVGEGEGEGDAPGRVAAADDSGEGVARHVVASAGAALAAQHDALTVDDDVPAAPGVAADALRARLFARTLGPSWVRRSYSSLVRDTATEASVRPDHDEAIVLPPAAELAAEELAAQSTEQSTEQGVEPLPHPASRADGAPGALRFSFVRGAHAGHCLHGVLEASDFGQGVDPAQARRHLERSAISADPAALARWLDEVLATPLDDGRGGAVDLRQVARRDRIVELAFLLPVRGAADQEILEAIADHYPLDLRGGGERWSGFLNGFIDLVYRDRGRYFLLDWKSNWLGDRHQDYGQAALADAIRAGSYALQFCLYAVALHRLLQRRLAGYRFEEHFGGVQYAFLRGMAPGQQDASGRHHGLYFARPPLGLIERLDVRLGRGAP